MKRLIGAVVLGFLIAAWVPLWPTVEPAPPPSGPVVEIAPEDLECLAKTIYFEARGESLAGMLAVGLVVLNRTASPQFPQDVCHVVTQGRYTGTPQAAPAAPASKTCQFSWYCDGHPDTPTNLAAWQRARETAAILLQRKVFDFTDGATHYHAAQVRPAWANGFTKVGAIGHHQFYRAANPEGVRYAKIH